MKKFLDLLLGTSDVPTYMAALLFALIGVAIVLLLKSKKRDKNSPNTPYHFDVWFLIQDNLKEIILGLLLILMALRFSMEYAGENLTMYYAFGVGLSLQKVSSWISNVELKARQ
ncbi:hypothetical protein GCM10008015_26970 [Flavobacterium palustre]|uniref:Uncharacterized protein n=1 Tax=Flavobacterium palustre TaxID=1476463 RepID=A0ABQ1HR30_9FLAO|nr:hypothetical protein [Flavobacterium palustre]GGA84797.1 hypothetical protein GCM10008015_26970 [Flavobacterium palustre]